MPDKQPNISVEYLPVSKLKPYKNNARKHEKFDIDAIAESIKTFGFCDPIGLWGDDVIVEGHGRVLAAKQLGMETVPCIRLDHLSDEERRAYALAHNQTSANSSWDEIFLPIELEAITEIDMTAFGFADEEDRGEYDEFVEKFKPKKTTDDCYTPTVVYEAISGYVAKKYELDPQDFVRPFYPGGNYKAYDYIDGAIVVDNPPFSILAEIVRFYIEKGIRFFLFAPTLTLFQNTEGVCAICTGSTITYENGATVNTSFLTNLEGGWRVRSDPDLYMVIREADEKNRKERKTELPKYIYPDYVVTATRVSQFSKYGIPFALSDAESIRIDALDEQRESGKAIYGHGYLVSERMKAEKEKAEKEKAEKEKAEKEKAYSWKLSERELEIVAGLG